MKDFTLLAYKSLLITLLQEKISTYTFEEYCMKKPQGKYIILRHDVDDKPERALAMAQLENTLGFRSTYYFRIVSQSNVPELIIKIAELGHEVGYHYEDLNMAKGNVKIALENYTKNLSYFRKFYSIKTISMHGSPREKYDNRDLWKEFDYHHFDVIGEPYFDFLNRGDVLYLTDTGRMWDGDKYNVRDKAINQPKNSVQKTLPQIHTTINLIDYICSGQYNLPLMISTHPQRWTNNDAAWWKEKIAQTIKNQVKAILK